MKILNASPGFGNALNEEQTKEFLAQSCRVLMLSTIDLAGHPNVHPVWYIYENGRIYVETSKKSLKVKNIRANPNVYYCVDDDCTRVSYKGVRGKAHARIIEDDSIFEIAVRIVTKYTGSIDNKMAKMILDGVKMHHSVILELRPKYYSTWEQLAL